MTGFGRSERSERCFLKKMAHTYTVYTYTRYIYHVTVFGPKAGEDA